MTRSLASPSDAAPAARRERAFDLLRGLCLVSMVFGHLAGGSYLDRITHAAGWVDGAVGFVFISGLVLGLVHRRTVDRSGLSTALGRILRRLRVIYAANVAVTSLALVVGTYLPAHSDLPSVHSYGWGVSVLRVLLVAVTPTYSVLGLYVFLMLGALGALTLLAHRRTGLLVGLSTAVFAGARLTHVDTSLPGHGHVAAFHVAGWQLLYVIGMVIGWHWRERRVELVLLRQRLQLPALVVVVALSCLSHVVGHGLTGPAASERLSAFFDKVTLAPGVLVFALAALAVGYRMTSRLLRSPAGRWVEPLSTVGRRSLDSYLIAMVATIVVPAVVPFPGSGWLAQGLAVAVLLTAYLWARLRDRGRTRRTADQPLEAAAASSPAPVPSPVRAGPTRHLAGAPAATPASGVVDPRSCHGGNAHGATARTRHRDLPGAAGPRGPAGSVRAGPALPAPLRQARREHG